MVMLKGDDIMEEKYRIIQRPKKQSKGNVEGIIKVKNLLKQTRTIIIKEWNNHKSSFWIRISSETSYRNEDFSGITKVINIPTTIILDSGVIEELAEEIKRLKKDFVKKK